MLSPLLPIPVINTWADSLVQTLYNLDVNYLQVIDNALSNPSIPGVPSSSGGLAWSNYLNYIGIDLQAADTILTEVSSTMTSSFRNMVVTSTYTVLTGTNPQLSFSAPTSVVINGFSISLAGLSINIPSAISTSYIIYASSTAVTSYTAPSTYTATLTSSTGAPLANQTNSVVELGYATIAGGGTTFTFTPVPNNRTFSWGTSLSSITSTYNQTSVSSSVFFIPFNASSTLEVTSIVTVNGVSEVFTNPSFIESQLVTSSLGYVQHMIGTRPVLFPTGTIVNNLITSISASGTVASSTLVTSTTGPTGFLATGTGVTLGVVTPSNATFIVRW